MHVQRDKVRAFHACLLGEWVVRVRETAYPIYNPALLISSTELFLRFCAEINAFASELLNAEYASLIRESSIPETLHGASRRRYGCMIDFS
jgi:hypothetical protein